MDPRARIKNENGVVFAMVVIIMLFLLPVVSIFLKRALTHNHHNTLDRQIKTARILSNNALVDLMRQFSQTHYEDHYATSITERSATGFKDVGFSSVTVKADPDAHTLFLKARGVYDKGLFDSSGGTVDRPINTKRLTGVIRFVSEILRFGTYWKTGYTVNAPDTTYRGGTYCGGNFTVDADNMRFEGGPVIIRGNFRPRDTGNSSNQTKIFGDLYVGGTIFNKNKIQIDLSKYHIYNFLPSVQDITIRSKFYEEQYSVKFTANTSIFFDIDSGLGVYRVGSPTAAKQPYPQKKAIFFIENANVNLRVLGSGLKGRVTVVCTGAPGSTTEGVANITGNILYEGGATSASASNAFALLATNQIIATAGGSNQDLKLTGMYYTDNTADGALQFNDPGGPVNDYEFYGSRMGKISDNFDDAFFQFDANLVKFPPPGLPERPVLVTWTTEH